jgi:hypothetical protein
MRTDGTPEVPAQTNTRTVSMGDVTRNPDTQAPAPPPSLTKPGVQLPDAARNTAGEMKPVQFPKQKPDDHPDAAAARRADQARAAEAAQQNAENEKKKASDRYSPQQPPAAQGSTPWQPSQTAPQPSGSPQPQ